MAGESKGAGAYLRISQDREGRDLGVDRQLAQCQELADTLGWDLIDVYTDNDRGASRYSRTRRPDYERMLAAARTGAISGIVALSTSRLTRKPRELEDLVDLVEDHGTEIRTVKVGKIDLATAQGRMLARILAAADAAEAEVNAERSKDEREQRRQRGRWHGGQRPFGWLPDRDAPGGLAEVPDEIELIRTACAGVLAGRTVASIARDWQQAGATPPAGASRWYPSVISDILRSPRLAGLLPDGRTAGWAPAVPEEVWRGVHAVLADPARRQNRGAVRLLTGIGVCGKCGATLHGGGRPGGRRGSYRCSASNHLDRLAEPVDEYVSDRLLVFLADKRLVGEVADDTAGPAREAAALRARLAELADLVADGAMSAAEYRPRAARLREQLTEAEGRLATATGTAALAALPIGVDELAAWWEDADVERQRAALRASGLHVVVHPPGRGTRGFNPSTVAITPKEVR